jgi:hypothetical protein
MQTSFLILGLGAAAAVAAYLGFLSHLVLRSRDKALLDRYLLQRSALFGKRLAMRKARRERLGVIRETWRTAKSAMELAKNPTPSAFPPPSALALSISRVAQKVKENPQSAATVVRWILKGG